MPSALRRGASGPVLSAIHTPSMWDVGARLYPRGPHDRGPAAPVARKRYGFDKGPSRRALGVPLEGEVCHRRTWSDQTTEGTRPAAEAAREGREARAAQAGEGRASCAGG